MNNPNNNINLTKSKERVQKHGEVFTPAWVVNNMLNILPEEVWETGKTFLEPACGEGAFLIEVYKRKLEKIQTEIQEDWEWQAAIATSSIYGIELLEDNAEQCTMNLMRLFTKFYDNLFQNTQDEEVIRTIQFLLSRNIIQGNFLTQQKCTPACGNKCNKCELVVISEWKILDNKQFQRRDFTLKGIVEREQIAEQQKKSLFGESFDKDNHGLVKEYKSTNWKDIRYATD